MELVYGLLGGALIILLCHLGSYCTSLLPGTPYARWYDL